MWVVLGLLILPVNLLVGGLLLLVGLCLPRPPVLSPYSRSVQRAAQAFALTSGLAGLLTLQPLYHVAGWISHYGLPAWVFHRLRGRSHLRLALLGGGLLLALIGLGNYFLGWSLRWQALRLPVYDGAYILDVYLMYPFGRARGFSLHPNTLGALLLLVLPLTVATLRSLTAFWPRMLAAVVCLSMALCLAVTFSRAAWIGSVVGLSWLVWGWGQRARWALLGGALGAVLLLWASGQGALLQARMSSLLDPTYTSNASRLDIWRAAWQMLCDWPWTGVGILQVESQYGGYQLGRENIAHLHNLYLQTAVESGLLASGFLWLLLILMFWRIRLREVRAAILAYAVASLFDYTLADLRVSLYFAALVAIGEGESNAGS
jgi:O-antigen ligase